MPTEIHSQLSTQWSCTGVGTEGLLGPLSKAKPNTYCRSKCFLFLQFWSLRGEVCWGASSLPKLGTAL